jgi:sugar O-acyltransferase (sialic acid O-acetyltransferase NeuD family)
MGGGGHCKACIDVVEQEGSFEIIGVLDQENLIGKSILGYSILGSDNDIFKYIRAGYSFLVSVGQVKSAEIRERLFKHLKDSEADIATIISPRSYVSRYAKIGVGTIVMHNVTINAGARIGENCTLNTGCNIEHDATVGDQVHVSTHAVVNGECEIGNGVFIGSNATILNRVKIIKKTVIGAGAVVIRTINESGTYAGNPAVKIK